MTIGIPQISRELSYDEQQALFNSMNTGNVVSITSVDVTSDIEGVVAYNGELFDGISSPDLKKSSKDTAQDISADPSIINLE